MPQPPQWPTRSAICLDCRTVLPPDTACPHGTHVLTSLRTPAGREALLSKVWGPRSLRVRMREAIRVGGLGGGGGALFDGCSGCDALDAADGHVLIAMVVAFFAFFALWFVGRWLADRIQQRQRRLRARGTPRELPAAPSTGLIGTIISREPLLAAPVDERPCVAFGLRILHGDDSGPSRPQAMLRDGATLGFEVALESGDHARIFAGPCVLDMTTARRDRPSPRLDDYLRTVDLQHGRGDDLEPFPCDHVEVATLAPGDRVEILSPVTSIAKPSSAPATYREAAGLIVPVGPVRLRPLPRA